MLHPGTVAQAHLSGVAERPVLVLVVAPPVEANAFREAALVVVVSLEFLVAQPVLPVAFRRGDAKLVVGPPGILYQARTVTNL